MFDDIIDARTDVNPIKIPDAFIHMKNGNKRRREKVKGWEICIQWNDSSSTGKQLKDVKESYPVQMAAYVAENELVEETDFVWWTKYTPKKRDRIISKTARKYWRKTQKYVLI